MYSSALLRTVSKSASKVSIPSSATCSGRRTSGFASKPGMSVFSSRQPAGSIAPREEFIVRQLTTMASVGRRHPSAFAEREFSPAASGARLFSTGQQGAAEGEEGKESAEPESVNMQFEDNDDMEGMEEKTNFTAAEIEELKRQIIEGDKKQQQFRKQAMYLAAEIENVRSIARKDAEGSRLYAVQKFAKQLLDVADNLERAVGSAKEGGGAGASLDNLLQGVEMTNDQLQKVFTNQGLEKFGDVGDVFDPHLHDAMFEMPAEGMEAGTLAQVLKCGYKLHDRVIRAAQVGIVKSG